MLRWDLRRNSQNVAMVLIPSIWGWLQATTEHVETRYGPAVASYAQKNAAMENVKEKKTSAIVPATAPVPHSNLALPKARC